MNTKNNNQKNESKKLEITSDNILHCLMHAATREDIAELRREFKNDISKLDDKASKADIAELKHNMELLRKENNKYFRWIVGLMFSSFAGIAIMILKFPMLMH